METATATEVQTRTVDWDDEEIGRWYWRVRHATAPLHQHWLKVETVGLENVPGDGGVIFAANHLSFLDSVLLMYSTPRQVTFLGKIEYLSRRATRRLFPAAGMIPVDRTGRGVGRSLGLAVERLRSGEVVGIFPEGTRSRDGSLGEGHVGVAHLALKSGAPIIPVGIHGSNDALAPGSMVPRRSPITLRFGAPIDLGRWSGARPTGQVKREITDEVMSSIAALSGQTVPMLAPAPKREFVVESSTTALPL
ncbi:MAG: 1-acyl-sn-glycerol-3-phosphate acyltransferase [Candidatus Aldehydirespiratoraceae bacterium]|jgi:1-acyl-sn-glycerol-3-phosphate acyltransferase